MRKFFLFLVFPVSVLAIATGLYLPQMQFKIATYGSISASQANNLCATNLGAIGQALDSQVRSACNEAGSLVAVGDVVFWIGVIAAVLSLVIILSLRRTPKS